MSLYVSTSHAQSTLELVLTGHWTVLFLPDIQKDMALVAKENLRTVAVNGQKLEEFDTSAAWYLGELVRNLRAAGIAVNLNGFRENHLHIYERVAALTPEDVEAAPDNNALRAFVTGVGMDVSAMLQDCRKGVVFLGQFLSGIPARILNPRSFRLRSIVFHINEVGIKAVPIIALMAFSIAFVVGYQGAFQLQKFDATVYTVDLIVLSTLREMGVLITAIMIAGRSGSAFAAQIGTMKLNEEVDALQTMGISPFEALVMPRMIAIIIALPLLTVIADIMGLLGGYIFSYSYLGYSYVQFLSRMQEAANLSQFYIGLVKAPVFAILIGIVGCMQGLQASGSAEDVGRKTITSVVQSIFLVIVFDAIFSLIFTKMGI